MQLSDVTRAFFTQTTLVETPQMARAMRAFVKDQGDSTALAAIAAEYEYNTLLRTTCVATLLTGGHASNALPQLAEANVNCRLFIRTDCRRGARSADDVDFHPLDHPRFIMQYRRKRLDKYLDLYARILSGIV